MGTPHPPEKALLFLALLFVSKEVLEASLPIFKERFGDTLLESPEALWSHSHYYDKELGTPVLRRFIFFSSLFDASTLPEIKLETNRLEDAFSHNGKRRINVDPGYITSSKVVLASAKDYSHRLYLGKGIYGEVALYFQGNRFNPMPYTYQDYKEPKGLDMFEKARKELKKLTGSVRPAPGYPGVLPHQNI
ncbi:MAG: DUF4416 family protein [Nitrospirae bacterium]|nr:DUF4416 family protein [Nitrospirota bacterium]